MQALSILFIVLVFTSQQILAGKSNLIKFKDQKAYRQHALIQKVSDDESEETPLDELYEKSIDKDNGFDNFYDTLFNSTQEDEEEEEIDLGLFDSENQTDFEFSNNYQNKFQNISKVDDLKDNLFNSDDYGFQNFGEETDEDDESEDEEEEEEEDDKD